MNSNRPKVSDAISTTTHSLDTPTTHYPAKELRYSRFWWNTNNQHCYTEADISLLKKITHIYHEIIGDDKGLNYFKTDTQSSWYDWWQCTLPAESVGTERLDHLHTADTYTLPNRPSKDSKLFPLWSYADNLAKTIANWQSDRVQGQRLEIMNDPVMLILDEMRNWFYHQLSEKECTTETLHEISKRQSYLKTITHTIPDFGMDRYRLHDLSLNLNAASDLIKQCIANKELPQLLSDLTISGKNLENTLSSYLHFLLINEKVADNFSPEMITQTEGKCLNSPLCKIYRTEPMTDATVISRKLLGFSDLPKFIKFTNEQINDGALQATATLPLAPLHTIKFASFVNDEQKSDYLRAITTLEALTTIRKTFEKFNGLQTKIGSYLFASHYIDQSSQLAEHYIQLIDSTNLLINKLINHAESGHSRLLQDKKLRMMNLNFESNLRSLETQFAKGTTTTLQLNDFCLKTIDNIQSYQQEMKRLISMLSTGEAAQEVNQAMNELYQQMNHLNQVIPALLGHPEVHIELSTQPATSRSDLPCRIEHQEMISPEPPANLLPFLERDGQCTVDDLENTSFTSPDFSWQVEHDPLLNTPKFNFFITQDNQHTLKVAISTTLLEIKMHPTTNKPIYVYGVQDQPVRGTVEFYGLPKFCVSSDKQQHNIIKTSGVFSEFQLQQNQLALENNICVDLPPSFLSTTLSAMGQSTLHGVLKGGANVIGENTSQNIVYKNIVTQTAYLSAAFATSFAYHAYQQYSIGNIELTSALSSAVAEAFSETATLAVTSNSINLLSSSLEAAGNHLLNNQWGRLGAGLKRASQVARYGFFAYNTVARGDFSSVENTVKSITTTSAAVIAGATAQTLTEETARRLSKK